LLFVIALIAIGLTAAVEWCAWNTAHERYDHTLAAWEFGYIRTLDVVSEAEALYNAELQTLWIPRSKARSRHAERLHKLADTVEARTRVTMYGSSGALEEQLQIAKELRAMVAELSAP
jgi:hypothetical protein